MLITCLMQPQYAIHWKILWVNVCMMTTGKSQSESLTQTYSNRSLPPNSLSSVASSFHMKSELPLRTCIYRTYFAPRRAYKQASPSCKNGNKYCINFYSSGYSSPSFFLLVRPAVCSALAIIIHSMCMVWLRCALASNTYTINNHFFLILSRYNKSIFQWIATRALHIRGGNGRATLNSKKVSESMKEVGWKPPWKWMPIQWNGIKIIQILYKYVFATDGRLTYARVDMNNDLFLTIAAAAPHTLQNEREKRKSVERV